ncbi:hypothetical protein [Granulosicoccus antarcticus]|uniref:hypothetical protein n=1 Tax=Granulosicoccus antarcticus TaxID=437505 RepID=UPI00197AB716|nr:hypothetical protein [Granulosicoccus antarcticus]
MSTHSIRPYPLSERVNGWLLVGITVLAVLHEWQPELPFAIANSVLVVLVSALFATRVRGTRLAFIIVAVVLTLMTINTMPDWSDRIEKGLGTAAFIGAFFCALNTLRNAAGSSKAIEQCGVFLAQQPPGRRYAALTVGAQAFALLLNYGAIALLGSLAMASANKEPNEEIRLHRTRRMLLAIQRGFIATLPWSPLSFAVVITTTVIPGATWAKGFWPCMLTGIIVSGIGWAMDSLFKPRLSASAPVPVRGKIEGSWFSVFPLLLLLGILGSVAAILHWLSGVRVAGIVLTVVPLIALGWIAWQSRHDRPVRALVKRAQLYINVDLPAFRNELTLLMMAGYIGTMGGMLLAPVVSSAGIDLSSVPTWIILVSLVWLIPLTGQVGMNPILAVSLFAPILPGAAALGVEPTAIMVAITAGWSLSGACSPFTATTMLIGSFANVSASHVGLKWNGVYTVVAALVLSAWVVLYSALFG